MGEGTTLVVPQVLQYSRRLQPPTAVIKLPRLLFICLESLAQEVATPPTGAATARFEIGLFTRLTVVGVIAIFQQLPKPRRRKSI